MQQDRDEEEDGDMQMVDATALGQLVSGKVFPATLSSDMYILGVTADTKSKLYLSLNFLEPHLDLIFRNYKPSVGSGLLQDDDQNYQGISHFKEAALLE